MNYSQLLEEMSVEDLPNEGLRMLASECGKGVVVRLLQGVPGLGFVVPDSGRKHLEAINAGKGDEARIKLIGDLTNENWALLAELCGVDVVLSLFENAAGAAFYVPKNGLKNTFKKFVVKHYNGHNARRLALLLRITQSALYSILNEKMGPVKRQRPVSENQLSIFKWGTNDA